MSAITNQVSAYEAYSNSKVDEKTVKDTNKTNVSGKTVGNPKLSEKAAKYYEELKKKYSNMDFILVSKDEKENAKSKAASFANANKTVVLIDEEKVERMAEDEKFRKQYEGIISNATNSIAQLKSSLENSGAKVKGYGIQVNDGGNASYFAVLEKSSEAQKERIEKKAEAKKEAKKEEIKKKQKKEQIEKLQEKRENKKAEKTKEDSTVTISATSIEELAKKVSDYTQLAKSDGVQTDAEKQVGQNIDFSI